ncbi:MAG: hypothetical protein ACYC7E_00435 [Armatimonadota bacterium]
MSIRLRHLSMRLLMVLLIVLCAVVARAAGTINVLVFDGRKIDARLAGELEKEGIHFVLGDVKQPISEEMLRQFHVVMLNVNEISINFQNPSPYFTSRENYARLLAYVKSGGALYLGGPVPGLTPGLGVVNREFAVRDDTNMWVEKLSRTDQRLEYARTSAITPHEATKGVATIFYPVQQGRWDDMYATHAFALSKEWTPLVSAMKTATVSRGFYGTRWEVIDRVPSPLFAARAFGDGRVAFAAVNPYYTFLNPYAPPETTVLAEFFIGRLDGIFLEKGDGKLPSQGRLLLTNLLRWLAASGSAKGFGAYAPESYAKLQKPPLPPIPTWIGQHGWMGWSENRGGTWRKVLIGARTSYSDGKGTVAEWAAAAREQGLTILGITETMEHFDPANWNRLKEECRKASDDNLKVVHGLDLADQYGNRFIVLNNDAFPPSSLTKTGGKIMALTHYLGLRMGDEALTIAHRLTTSPVLHQLLKHYQGISIYTYRNGKLEDNSYPAYEWQAFRYSNPMPFAIHETYAPEDLAREATTGHQVLLYTGTAQEAAWYLVGSHGSSHFWETPTKLQITDGPRLLAFNDRPYLKVVSDVPITDVRIIENYNIYRRWKPNANEFTAESAPPFPKKHWAWYLVVATDAKGRTVVSPPLCSGQAGSFAWRCGDRQNWLQGGPNIYPGWLDSDTNIAVPVFGTDEGKPSYFGYPHMNGPLRGDNMCPMLDFPFTSQNVQIQDVYMDERYYKATWNEVAGDAKSAHVTSRSRVYAAKVRYLQFFQEQKELPRVKSVSIRLRRPVDATDAGDIFPVFAGMRNQWADLGGDYSYAYVDPQSGKSVTGKLAQGYLDLPKGGRLGGFIALSDGIRIGRDGRVGFTPRQLNGALPVNTEWNATFTTMPISEAEMWRQRMGFTADTPFALALSQGALTGLAYIADCQAKDYGIAGSVTKTMTDIYRLPVRVSGVSYNWDAGLWRPGQGIDPVDVFEGAAIARLDVSKLGDFYLGNLVTAGNPHLRLNIIDWSAASLKLDIHNPTDRAIECEVTTIPAIKDRCQVRNKVIVPPGTSQQVEWKP